MTVYVLFGKTGSGKSHISKSLEKLGIKHLDGDQHITDEMRNCLKNDKQMTPAMIDRFVDVLISKIKLQQQEFGNESFIVSQALYLDVHRKRMITKIPGIKFVYIKAPALLRTTRINSRFRNKESKISSDYAKDMDKFFEEPTHACIELNNNHQSSFFLLQHIEQELSDLNFNNALPFYRCST